MTAYPSPRALLEKYGLRAAVAERAREYEGMKVSLPAPRLCTDNAAMIAVAGTHALLRGERAGPELSADPAWRL